MSSCPDTTQDTSPAKGTPQKTVFCDFGWDESESLGDSKEDDATTVAVAEWDTGFPQFHKEDSNDLVEERREKLLEEGI